MTVPLAEQCRALLQTRLEELAAIAPTDAHFAAVCRSAVAMHHGRPPAFDLELSPVTRYLVQSLASLLVVLDQTAGRETLDPAIDLLWHGPEDLWTVLRQPRPPDWRFPPDPATTPS